MPARMPGSAPVLTVSQVVTTTGRLLSLFLSQSHGFEVGSTTGFFSSLFA